MYRHVRLSPTPGTCCKCQKEEGFIVWDSILEELVILCVDCLFFERILDYECVQVGRALE